MIVTGSDMYENDIFPQRGFFQNKKRIVKCCVLKFNINIIT